MTIQDFLGVVAVCFAPAFYGAFSMLMRLSEPSYAENWTRAKREMTAIYFLFACAGCVGTVVAPEQGLWFVVAACFAVGHALLRSLSTSVALRRASLALTAVFLAGGLLGSLS